MALQRLRIRQLGAKLESDRRGPRGPLGLKLCLSCFFTRVNTHKQSSKSETLESKSIQIGVDLTWNTPIAA